MQEHQALHSILRKELHQTGWRPEKSTRQYLAAMAASVGAGEAGGWQLSDSLGTNSKWLPPLHPCKVAAASILVIEASFT